MDFKININLILEIINLFFEELYGCKKPKIFYFLRETIRLCDYGFIANFIWLRFNPCLREGLCN